MTVTIFEKSVEGRRAFVAPELDVPARRRRLAGALPALRAAAAAGDRRAGDRPPLHDAVDAQLPRRQGLLSARLVHDEAQPEAARARGGAGRLRAAAPAPGARAGPGRARLMWELQRALAEIAGLPHVSLQPSAGRRASWRACCSRAPTTRRAGEHRHKVLTPDTAHGTNPATVTMAGYEVVKLGTADDGGVDLDDLRSKVDDDVASLMLTNPNTLGVFDRNIEEIARMVHDAGATLYYDGAEPQRGDGPRAAGRHGVRHRPLQPAQDLHAAARRRRPGGGADRGVRPDRAVPAAPAGRPARGRRRSSWTSTARSRSAACAASRATSASSCAPTPTSCRWAPTGWRRRATPRC